MGGTSGKFRKALQAGDEKASEEIYFHSSDFQKSFDPNTSYGENYNHNTPLHYAARYGMLKMLTIFLQQHRGNPNKRNNSDQSALHCICMDESILPISHSQSQYYSQPPEKKRLECLKLLVLWRGITLQSGEQEHADVNASDSDGNTPLHYAASSGYRALVELLIESNASLFTENVDKETPCDKAEKNRLFEIAQLLESKMVFCDVGKEDSVEDLSALQYEESYLGMRTQDLQEEKDQLLVETADMLRVPLFTAEALLRQYDWSRESLLEAWISSPQECCELSGVKPPDNLEEMRMEHKLNYSEQQRTIRRGYRESIVCEICIVDIPLYETPIHIPCAHLFCSECWERYLTGKIMEGSAHSILCPAHECYKLVPVEVIESVVSSEMARRYLQFDIKAFVESNPNFKWCPMVGCGRAVKLPDNMESPTQRGPTSPSSPPPMSRAVDCGSGHLFCWDCLHEPHAPCSCQNWKRWNDKIKEIQPESPNFSIVTRTDEETEAAANGLWLVTNSKSCPKCNAPIQKNEGCNHMKCTKCKYDFCWVCLEPWNKHNSSTGGYFRCNRYEVVQKVEEKADSLLSEAEKKMKEMEELNRFLHYYTRFYNHGNSFQLEKPLINKAMGKMRNLAFQAGKSGIRETKFILAAIEELLKARSILRFSYPYGYFLEDRVGERKHIFEFMQNELEESAENLSQMVARQFLRTPRSKIIHAMHLTTRKRYEFLSAVSKGFLPPDSPLFQRRRSSYQPQEEPVPWNDDSDDDDEELRRAIEASIQDAMGSFASLASESQESSPSAQKKRGKGQGDLGQSTMSSGLMQLEMSQLLLLQQADGITPSSSTGDPSSPQLSTPELPTRRDKKLKVPRRSKRSKYRHSSAEVYTSDGGHSTPLSSYDYDIQRAMELSLQEARRQQEQPSTSQGDDTSQRTTEQSIMKVKLDYGKLLADPNQGSGEVPSSVERRSRHSSPRPKSSSAIVSSSKTSSKLNPSASEYSKSSGRKTKASRHKQSGEGDKRGCGDSSTREQGKDSLWVPDKASPSRRSRPSSVKNKSESQSGSDKSPVHSTKVTSSNSFSGKRSTYTYETAAYKGILKPQASPKKIPLNIPSRSSSKTRDTGAPDSASQSSVLDPSSGNVWQRMDETLLEKTQNKNSTVHKMNPGRLPEVKDPEIEDAVLELKSVGTNERLSDQINQLISRIDESSFLETEKEDKTDKQVTSVADTLSVNVIADAACLEPEKLSGQSGAEVSYVEATKGSHSDESILFDPLFVASGNEPKQSKENSSDPWVLEDIEFKFDQTPPSADSVAPLISQETDTLNTPDSVLPETVKQDLETVQT